MSWKAFKLFIYLFICLFAYIVHLLLYLFNLVHLCMRLPIY